MALNFSVNVPSTSAVHVVVMCGRLSAIAFRVRITVKIGVRVCTTLTAMQSLCALGNLCVCMYDICISRLCLYVHMCICIFCFIPVCLIYLTFHLLLLSQLLDVTPMHRGVWSICVEGYFRKQAHNTLGPVRPGLASPPPPLYHWPTTN